MHANIYRFSALGFKFRHFRMEFCEESQKFKSSIKPDLHIKAHSKSPQQVIFKSLAPWVLHVPHSYLMWRKKKELLSRFVVLTTPE